MDINIPLTLNSDHVAITGLWYDNDTTTWKIKSIVNVPRGTRQQAGAWTGVVDRQTWFIDEVSVSDATMRELLTDGVCDAIILVNNDGSYVPSRAQQDVIIAVLAGA